MIFRKAAESDAKRCLEIYDAISDWEMANGKQCYWEKGYGSAFMSFYEKMAYDAGCKSKSLHLPSCNTSCHLAQEDFFDIIT